MCTISSVNLRTGLFACHVVNFEFIGRQLIQNLQHINFVFTATGRLKIDNMTCCT